MENCARQLNGGELEETIVSASGPSATPDVTSNSHTGLEKCILSLDKVALGDCSGARSSMEPKSEYSSKRVEEMMRSRGQFSSDVEHEIEHSKGHWSEVSGAADTTSEVSGHSGSSEENDFLHVLIERMQKNVENLNVGAENIKVFMELMDDPKWKLTDRGDKLDFFVNCSPPIKLGRKIAEGGQAEIFEFLWEDGTGSSDIVLKVFKKGYRLSDLKKQWPGGILRREVRCIASLGFMLHDGRFAFGMDRFWGDLRKLIDQAMQEKNNQGPPFPYELSGCTWHAKVIMGLIACHVDELHKKGIIHRDLKAANILIDARNGKRSVIVADFECSIGVLGTGFWRAPEILLAVKNKVDIPFWRATEILLAAKDKVEIPFSEKMDVYAYGMTCFEIVTGRMPFEGELEENRDSYDLVIKGWRPKLPSDLDVTLKDLIERCWNPIPNERPSFEEIIAVLDCGYGFAVKK